jgi:hypothetical protein
MRDMAFSHGRTHVAAALFCNTRCMLLQVEHRAVDLDQTGPLRGAAIRRNSTATDRGATR